MNRRILHITGYMGDAGIGKAISGLILNDRADTHVLFCLEKSSKRNEISKCIDAGIEVVEDFDLNTLAAEINKADVVILHWWDYPPINKLLTEFPECPCRIVLWSHSGGVTYPFLPFDFLDEFQRVFFTSPVSYENREWSEIELQVIRDKSDVIYGLADIKSPRLDNIKDRYGVLYAGTFTESKIHPEFPLICKKIIDKNPDIRFTMLGDDTRAEWLKREINNLGIEQFFKWPGFVNNVLDYMRKSRIFLYPLNPFHFGTTENVMIEAMSSGLPIVAFNQAAEKYIIDDNITGILCDDLEGMAETVCTLYDRLDMIERFGVNAINKFMDEYSMKQNVEYFRKGIDKCMLLEPVIHKFNDQIGNEPHEWFLKFVPENIKKRFLYNKPNEKAEKFPAIFSEKTKSSVHHFIEYFQADKELKKYASIIDKADHRRENKV